MLNDLQTSNKRSLPDFSKHWVTTVLLTCSLSAWAQSVEVDEFVKAGGVRCLRAGQDEKVYKTFYAGDGRYFKNPILSTDARDGEGNCAFLTDSSEEAITYQKFATWENGQLTEIFSAPVKVVVRAYADCGNLLLPASDMRQVCRFRATTVRASHLIPG